jgi:hypothetical protein
LITEFDLREAIAELQGHKNPTSTDCQKLAAYYTILDHLADDTDGETRGVSTVSYSRSEPPQADNIIEYNFTCQALKDGLNGKNSDVAYMILDELMNAVRVTNPELYRFAVRKLNA